MWSDFPLFPVQASTSAPRVDALYFFLIAVSLFFTLLIGGLLIVFAARYRARPGGTVSAATADAQVPHEKPAGHQYGFFFRFRGLWLECVWTFIPLGIAMIIFTWGARVYFHLVQPPEDTMNIAVVGKRWMWKLQHITGRREINELHIPVGRAVRLTMTSEDVIHSFYVPAFRIKQDALPGRYTTAWFQATRTGRYHLFCTEYCGTRHSGMIGWVVVQEPSEFQSWLGGGQAGVSMAEAGSKLFADLGCFSCHGAGPTQRGPALAGIYGSMVRTRDGSVVAADETYLRESILDPSARIVAGYDPIMPTFRGLVDEEGLLQILEYLKTLSRDAAGAEDGKARPGEARGRGDAAPGGPM